MTNNKLFTGIDDSDSCSCFCFASVCLLWFLFFDLPCFIQNYPTKQRYHRHEDEDSELELIREHIAAQQGSDHVSCSTRVFLHYVVQLLQDCSYNQSSNTATHQGEAQHDHHPS